MPSFTDHPEGYHVNISTDLNNSDTDVVTDAGRKPSRRRLVGVTALATSVLATGLVTLPVTTSGSASEESGVATATMQVEPSAADPATNVFGQPMPQAQAVVGPLNEYIWNVYEADGTNVVIGVTWTTGRYEAIAPGVRYMRNIKSFTIPATYCAEVKYNGGYPQRRGPGTHTSFADGVVLTIDPYKC